MRTLIALVLALTLVACADEPDDPGSAGNPVSDVEVATELMHRDAALLNLLDVGLGRPLPDDVVAATEQLRLETTERIETAADLFDEWGEKPPVTVRDHSAGHGSDHDVPALEGMPTGEDLQALGALPRREFEPAFRTLLVDTLEATRVVADRSAGGDVAALAADTSRSCSAALDTLA